MHHFVLSEWVDDAFPFCFSTDEAIAAQVDNGKVLLFDPSKLGTSDQEQKDGNGDNGDGGDDAVICTVEAAKAVSVSIAPCSRTATEPQETYYFAIFALATTYGFPTVKMHRFQTAKGRSTQIAQRQFMSIDECRFCWNPRRNGSVHRLLIVASSDTDTFGQSYYGKQELYLMSTDSSNTKQVEVAKKLQDVQWHPFGTDIVMIHDHPRKVSVISPQTGECVQSIGQFTRNTIRFSECGHFLWLGGFGNLTGEMSFYDYVQLRKEEEGLKGFNKSDCARVYEWSPDSSVFLIASLHPYMTVDNGFTVYKYNGVKLYEERVDKLYQIAYRPSLYHVYPERAVSKKALSQSQPIPKSIPMSISGRKKGGGQQEEEAQKTKYVPPHLRNRAKKKKAKASTNVFG